MNPKSSILTILMLLWVLTAFCALGEEANDEESDYAVFANVSLVSKYLWRGYNLNDNVSIQGGLDFEYKSFYLGAWGGTDEELGTEINLYGGFAFDLSDSVAMDIGVIQYRYDEDAVDDQYEEYYLGFDFSVLGVKGYFGEDDYQYFEVTADFDLNENVSLGLKAGYEDDGEDSYMDYQATLNYSFNDIYGIYISATDKEDLDSEIFIGITAEF